jgi:hypothetical protein
MNKPLTSEEQAAALGRVKYKPSQRDMFTGEISEKPPKRGNGSHIILKPIGIEKPTVPGMADYAGEGPDGKYCRDCSHYGEVAVQRPNGYVEEVGTVEMNRGGCVIYASRMGHSSVVAAKSIELCNACKLFEEPKAGDPRCFVIGPSGVVSRLHAFPKPLKTWRPTQP